MHFFKSNQKHHFVPNDRVFALIASSYIFTLLEKLNAFSYVVTECSGGWFVGGSWCFIVYLLVPLNDHRENHNNIGCCLLDVTWMGKVNIVFWFLEATANVIILFKLSWYVVSLTLPETCSDLTGNFVELLQHINFLRLLEISHQLEQKATCPYTIHQSFEAEWEKTIPIIRSALKVARTHSHIHEHTSHHSLFLFTGMLRRITFCQANTE